jgi:DNA-binding transcriptional ArsR family regulator
MLARLAADGDATGAELGVDLPISQQAVSKHLQVLERAGLITRTPDAQRRTCHLAPERLETAIEWIEHHRQLWADRYDRLDAHLRTLRPTKENTP